MTNPIYKVFFDGVLTKTTLSYEEAKASFSEWKDYMQDFLCFEKVLQIKKDNELLMEYTHE